MSSTVTLNDYIAIKTKDRVFIKQISQSNSLDLKTCHLSLKELVDQKINSLFEIRKKKLHKIDPSNAIEYESYTEGNSIQNDTDEVLCDGENLVQNLIKENNTFGEKTLYSKSKYVFHKRKKHIKQIALLAPTPKLVWQMLYNKNPSSILHMRYDTVAKMMHLSNIHSGSRVLLFDGSQGFLLACILRKLSSLGKCLHIYNQDVPNQTTLGYFNFSAETLPPNILSCLHIDAIDFIQDEEFFSDLSKSENVKKAENATLDEDKKRTNNAMPSTENSREDFEKSVMERVINNVVKSVREKKSVKRKRIDDALVSKAELLNGKKFDCLIIANKNSSLGILKKLIKFVAPCKPILIYSYCLQSLVDVCEYLKERNNAIDIRISETWLRKYQVLKDRTHPVIAMNEAASGYLLYAKSAHQPSNKE